jgi:F420-dependent oxidoreductase-like protein
MLEVAVMIESQDGLNWPRWQHIARAVEDLGFAGLYRSDHFTNSRPPNKDSLEQWLSFTWLATHTHRIEFGSLVSPVSFRDPVFTARMALQVGDLSGGRLRLGLGAGWQEREHEMFGYELLSLPRRFLRFQEGLEVITRLIRYGDEPVDFNGQFYHLRDAVLLPRPAQTIPIVIGGNGPKYTLPLVVRYADEWNAVDIPAEKFSELNKLLDGMLRDAGRAPASLRRTLMTSLIFGRTEAELRAKVEGRTTQSLRNKGVVIGTAGSILDQLERLEAAGVQRVMLRWADLDDLDSLTAFATEIGLENIASRG